MSVPVGHVGWNTYNLLGRAESDYFFLTRAGYGHDFEIKISYSDFKAEFSGKSVKKRDKHKFLNDLWTCVPHRRNPTPHEYRSAAKCVKAWWMVLPESLAAQVLNDPLLPPYAGVIEVFWYGTRPIASVLREAPTLKGAVPDFSIKPQLMNAAYYKAVKRYSRISGEPD